MSIKPSLTSHLIEEAAQRWPEKTAVKHRARSMTYAELYEESAKMAEYLRQTGVRKGDRVGILLDKSIEQLASMFAASMAGAVYVFLNPFLKKQQIEYIIEDCQIRVLITTSLLHSGKELDNQGSRLFVDRGGDISHPCWPEIRDSISVAGGGVRCIPEDTACLIYTSGSTGMPKGVVVPHHTVVEGAKIVGSYLGVTMEDRILGLLPFNFDYGMNQATTSVLHGATLVLHQFMLVKDLLGLLKKEKITGFAGMTPIWAKLFDGTHSIHGDRDCPDLRYITNTGGKVPRPILEKMKDSFPKTDIFLMYGLTEAFRSTYLPPEDITNKPDSIGKAIPNVDIIVVNREGRECEPGEVGELVHRGALVTKGYWNDPEKTKEVFRCNPLLDGQDHLLETVVYSGDLVKRDREGYIYFVSRKDEMIKTSGYRVSPTEIEEILAGVNDVRDAAVFGRETDSGDQEIVAVVEHKGAAPDSKTIMAECRKKLPLYMVPRAVHFEKKFPTTANGKIDRSFLRRKWESGNR